MKIIIILATLFLLFLPVQAQAEDYYVRDGTGLTTNCGTDWSNACDTLPDTLQRGDTYYVADGSYSGYNFNDPESGTQYITIKKATISDHGTSVGWQGTYGNGQAVFGTLTFSNSYYTFDGQQRTGIGSGHGFKINAKCACKGIAINAPHLTLRYFEIEGNGRDGNPSGANDLIYCLGPDNVNIQYAYLHDSGRTHILSRGCNNWIVENSYFLRHESTGNEHSESWSIGTSSNVVFRNNIVQDFEGTAAIAALDSNPGPSGWEIYGNVFYSGVVGNGIIETDTGSSWTNSKVYNNVFAENGGYQAGITPDQGGNTWEIYNNIWYNNDASSLIITGNHDYNWFYGNTGSVPFETNSQIGSENPFVNPSGLDFRLSSPTDAGLTLSSPYDIDPAGNTRGADGTWDRGAYEYSSSGCSCGSWIDGNCQAGSCGTGERQQTTTCTPSGCGPETRCVADPACDIACSSDQDCNDNNPCTDDSCTNPGTQSSSCQYTSNTGSCNDGNSCTSGDTCSSGSCSGTPITQCSLTHDSCCPSGCDETTDPDCSGNCQDLLALYNFEGDAQDSSGNNHHGTPNGPTLTSGQNGYGQAYNFDGTGDYINLGGLDVPGSEMTISMWINPDDFGVYDARLISKSTSSSEQDHYWMLSTFTNQFLRARLNAGGSTSTLIASQGALAAGTWSHVALTYDGTNMKLFLNGQEVASQAKSGTLDANPAVNAYIGLNPDGYGPFDGTIDDVAIWERALTLSEIQDIHSAGQSLSCQSQPTCQSEGYQCCSSCEPGTEQTTYDPDCSGEVCCESCYIECSSNQDCNDNNPCTDDSCTNPGTQSSSCQNSPITQCSLTSDSCCPAGCTGQTDSDCSTSCPDIITLYNFEGDAQDSSGNNLHGTVNNGATLTTGQTGYGQAYSFDGTDDYISADTVDDQITDYPFTISAWVSTTSTDWGSVASLSDPALETTYIDIHINNTGMPISVVRTDSSFDPAMGTISINDGNWHHVAAVFHSEDLREIYVDGTLSGSNSVSKIFPTVTNFNIGRLGRQSHTNYFDGLIDDVVVFSKALTLGEIQDIHSAGQSFSCTQDPPQNQYNLIDSDIGDATSGSHSVTDGSYSIIGSGTDIVGTSDDFHFTYMPTVHDSEISTRVTSVENTHSFAKAGIMVRQDLTDSSPYAFIYFKPNGEIRFMYRETSGGDIVNTGGSTAIPYWVRIVRTGDLFEASESSDGTNWNLVGSATISMAPDAFTGFAVTSHDVANLCTMEADSLSIKDFHRTDSDHSCSIGLDEVNSFINLWHADSTENPINTLMESLAYYYSPGYC